MSYSSITMSLSPRVMYDAKWCPDHLNIAASDSHGPVLFFSANGKETQGQDATKCPEEMFFHVLDEQTQCAPHLLPPPFLVDVEGNPYPADIQKLVLGREHLSDKELLEHNVGTMWRVPYIPPPPRPRRPPAWSLLTNIRFFVQLSLRSDKDHGNEAFINL